MWGLGFGFKFGSLDLGLVLRVGSVFSIWSAAWAILKALFAGEHQDLKRKN